MVNWSNYKIYFILLTLTFFSFFPTNNKWGFYGHKKINRMAVFTLPPELFTFYKSNIDYLTDHSVDPDKRRYTVKEEACRHYIDIDHYYVKDSSVFEVMPKSWKNAVLKYSEDTLKEYGIVPWHIQTMKYRLQKAFEDKNTNLILKYSSEIGHYIADAHVPLHTTENYNGQLTNQHGIHALWETNVVELKSNSYNYFIPKASYIPNTLEYIWNTIEVSHSKLDSVLLIEKQTTTSFATDEKYTLISKGKKVVKSYSKKFTDTYSNNLNGMVEKRMRKAIETIGCFWYTAWVDAGQPNLLKMNDINTLQEDSLELNPYVFDNDCIH
jgi:hypothetical protein